MSAFLAAKSTISSGTINALLSPADAGLFENQFKGPKISPKSPRALYFSDNTAGGYVPQGDDRNGLLAAFAVL